MRAPLVILTAAVGLLAVAAAMWSWDGSADDPVRPADPSTTTPVSATGAGDQRRTAVVTPPPADLAPGQGLLRVLVRDESDAPLADCTVKLRDGESRVTGGDGAVEFRVPAQRAWVEVTPADALGRYPLQRRVSIVGGRAVSVVFVLQPKVLPEYWCRVVAGAGGPAIAGAKALPQPYGEQEIAAGDDGLVQVPAGSEMECLRISAEGFAPRRVIPGPGHASANSAFLVPLERAAALHLLVVDSKDKPVDGAEVQITAMPFSLMWPATAAARGGPEIWTLRTDPDGRGEASGLVPECPLFVSVTPPAGLAVPTTSTLQLHGGANEARIVLQATGEIRGRVVDATGRIVPRAQVIAVPSGGGDAPALMPDDAVGEAVTAGEDGTFRLGPLAPGTWLLGLQNTEGWTARARRIVLPAAGSVQADVLAEPGLTIRGRLLGPGGRPINVFTVHAQQSGRIIASAITGDDGGYVLGPLAPGEYEVVTELYEGNLATAAPVIAQAGQSGIDVRVLDVLGTLRGRVEAAELRGDVWLRGKRRDGVETASGRCDLDGTFEQPRLRSGTWDFAFADEHGRVGLLPGVAIQPGEATPPVVVELVRGGTLRASHPQADQFEVRAAGGSTAVSGALERGLPGEVVVPAGDWIVVFSRGGFEIAQKPIAIRAGETLMVDGG